MPLAAGEAVDHAPGKLLDIGQLHGALGLFTVFAGKSAQGAMPGMAAKADQFMDGDPICRRQLLRQVSHLPGEFATAPGAQGFAVEFDLPACGRLLAGEHFDQGRLA
ncbi:hypothetical protein D9M68_956750 [compost metagenome]